MAASVPPHLSDKKDKTSMTVMIRPSSDKGETFFRKHKSVQMGMQLMRQGEGFH